MLTNSKQNLSFKSMPTNQPKPNNDGHSRISPSKLRNLEICPCYASDDSFVRPAAEEGTQAHEYVEALLNKDKKAKSLWEKLSDDQKDFCLLILDYLEREILPKASKVHPELKLDLTFAGVEGMEKGTADAVFEVDENTICLCDWKFGRLEVDDAEKNIQLQTYGIAAMRALNKTTCDLYILSPRRNEITTATITIDDEPEILTRIRTIAARVNAPDKTPRPHDSCCMWCAKLATCEAVASYALVTASPQFKPAAEFNPHFDSLLGDPEKMSHLYTMASILEKWASTVKTMIVRRVSEGHEIPGYRLVNKRGRRSCIDPVGAYHFLRDKYQVHAEQFLTWCNFSLSKAEKELAAKYATKGNKKAAEEQLSEEIADAGFVVTGDPIQYLQRSK